MNSPDCHLIFYVSCINLIKHTQCSIVGPLATCDVNYERPLWRFSVLRSRFGRDKTTWFASDIQVFPLGIPIQVLSDTCHCSSPAFALSTIARGNYSTLGSSINCVTREKWGGWGCAWRMPRRDKNNKRYAGWNTIKYSLPRNTKMSSVTDGAAG